MSSNNLESSYKPRYREKLPSSPGVSITQPNVKISFDKVPEQYKKLFDLIFEGTSTMEQRIEKFKEISKFFAMPKEQFKKAAKAMKATEFMQNILFMDFMMEISLGFDSQTSGHLFEYFSAFIVGGRATGVEAGEGGVQDAVDFETEGGELGSAKLVRQARQTAINQKVSGFEKYINDKITYVIAVKKGSPYRMSKVGLSPLEVSTIDLYTVLVEYKGNGIFFINGKQAKDSKGQPKIYKQNQNLILGGGKSTSYLKNPIEIQIMSTTPEGIKSYRETLDLKLGEAKKELLENVKNIFDNLKKADSKGRDYVSSGNLNDGLDALTSLSTTRDEIIKLRTSGGDEYATLPNNA